MKAPSNTAVVKDPLGVALATATPGYLEHMEAEGLTEFIESDVLPTRMKWDGHDYPSVKAVLQAAGVEFLGEVEGDPLFQFVRLPAGWSKVAVTTFAKVHANLLDGDGAVRAHLHYNAAFYNRRASLTLAKRWSWMTIDVDPSSWKAVVTDGGKPQCEFASVEEAEAWLDSHWPRWQVMGAYWPEEAT